MDKFIIEQENSSKRVDKFLAQEFFLYTRGDIVKKIAKGEISVNGKSVKPSYKLAVGDIIDVLIPFEKPKLVENPNIRIDIIYEDKNLLVVNKPAGLQVHPSNINKENTLVNGLIVLYPEIVSIHDDSFEAEFRPGIVHRLDRDTSGLMVIAKTMKAFLELKQMFKDRLVQKKYIAITYGVFEEKKGVIDKALARALSYRKQTIANKKTRTTVRAAATEYEVISEKNGFSMVSAWPKTGRTHQIRIHLSSIGHSIVGDKLYISKDLERYSEEYSNRQLLHAAGIEFKLFRKKYAFSVDIPADFGEFWQHIDEISIV